MNTKSSLQSQAKWGRHFLSIVLLSGLALGQGAVAWAGFFDACVNATARRTIIEVTQNTLVKNETVTLPGTDFRDCEIDVADGVTLAFKNVRVAVAGDTRLAFGGRRPAACSSKARPSMPATMISLGLGPGCRLSSAS